MGERFLLRLMQLRVGPRVVRFFGVLQTILDGRKLFFKGFFGFLFFRAAFFSFQLTILAILSFLNFGSLSFFSLFRSNIISICFDVLFCFLLIFFVFINPFFVSFLFFVLLMEVGRTPYDLNERESELVSRYNIEYSGVGFTFLFLREYLGLLFAAVLLSQTFLSFQFGFLFFIVLIRRVLPRLKFFGVLRHSFGALNLFCFLFFVFSPDLFSPHTLFLASHTSALLLSHTPLF